MFVVVVVVCSVQPKEFLPVLFTVVVRSSSVLLVLLLSMAFLFGLLKQNASVNVQI